MNLYVQQDWYLSPLTVPFNFMTTNFRVGQYALFYELFVFLEPAFLHCIVLYGVIIKI